jgi:hypothetical protein
MLISGILLAAMLGVDAQIADAPELAPAPFERATFSGLLADRRIVEASGLALSQKTPDRFWVLNDGGNGPLLFAISGHGASQGFIQVDGAINTDWEDLASYSRDGTAYLVVADVGDNMGQRPSTWVHLVEEPAEAQGQAIKPLRSIQVTLEDEPHDIEAVAVDVADNAVLLLTKRIYPAFLFRLSLEENPGGGPVVARKIAELATIPQPTPEEIAADPRMGKYRSQPTSMDLSADGRKLIVLTYRHAYLFERGAGESWAKVMARAPTILKLPPLPGGEAISFDQQGGVMVTTEKWPAPVVTAKSKP